MPLIQTRRRFLTTTATAGVASVLRAPQVPAADGALETTTVRVGKGSLCAARTYLAEELLRAEGFTEVRYPKPAKPEPNRISNALHPRPYGLFLDDLPIHIRPNLPAARVQT